MPKYYSDSTDSIKEIFELEGDALRKSGFSFPDVGSVPEEAQGVFNTQNSTKLPSPVDEANRLGIDLEDYLEG